MGKALARRGPDDEKFYDDGVLSFVFRRLSIVGGGNSSQPIYTKDKNALLIANGEIYNHLSVRGQLSASYAFSGNSDCEVLLHGFEHWGIGVFSNVRGMFAAALWEKNSKRLVLARDRLGIKPLYIFPTQDGLVFSSELKALLLHPECPRTPDLSPLQASLYSFPETPTYISGVRFLPAGCYAILDPEHGYSEKSYWSLSPHLGEAYFGENHEAYISRFRELIEESTAEHLQGESQIALHLSGGQDSALLAACVTKHTKNVPCFTVVERTTVNAGDVDAARSICNTLGLPWYPVLYDFRSLVSDLTFDLSYLEEVVWSMDSPRMDLEFWFKQELNRVIRREFPTLKTLLLGQGADEFAGGYSKRIDVTNSNWSDYLKKEVSPMILEANQVVAPSLEPNSSRFNEYHEAMLLFARQLQHHNFWHEDRTSAWYGMEARVPFLDHRIVELLASVPKSIQKDLFWNKNIVRECSRRIFPSYDSHRPKVGFFCTDDMRSIHIIAHSMACRLVHDFTEKYLETNEYPFDKNDFSYSKNIVLSRLPGFYAESFRLLQLMTSAIFNYQCRNPEAFIDNTFKERSGLKIIASRDFLAVRSSLSAEPEIRNVWKPTDCIRIPEGYVVRHMGISGNKTKYGLATTKDVLAEIEVPNAPAWISVFFRNIGSGNAKDFTVHDWQEEFDITIQEFGKFLDTLYLSGFINKVKD